MNNSFGIFRAVLLIGVLFNTVIALGQVKWSAERDVAAKAYGNSSPRIEMGSDGKASILWGHNGNVYFSQWSSGGFTLAMQLNPAGVQVAESYWMGPELAVKGDTILVVFKQVPENNVNSHIYSMRSLDGGQTFEDTVRVDDIGSDLSRFPTIAIDDNGNPIVAFMRFSPGFGEPHWVVALSNDYGQSYEKDFELGPKSSPNAEACDCCPGSVNARADKITVTYRNNDNNIRDIWMGFGSREVRDNDRSIDLDGHNWSILSCPASAPASVIHNDSVYTMFMNGASGTKRVYFSRASLQDGQKKEALLLNADLTGVGVQDFPRMSHQDGKLTAVWRQMRNNKIELALAYRNDITTGQFRYFSSLAIGNARNADVSVHEDSIYLVWQDNVSGTVKFRAGSTADILAVPTIQTTVVQVYPNPTRSLWTVGGLTNDHHWFLQDVFGNVLSAGEGANVLDIPSSGLTPGCYWLTLHSDSEVQTLQLIKI